MQRTTVVVSRWALSTGTLLAVGGGLALYQMTSLVLGSAGSRDLHLTLSIPAVEVDESSPPFASSVNLALGGLAGRAFAPAVSAPLAPRRTSGPLAARRPLAPAPAPAAKVPPAVPAPAAKTPPVVPVPTVGSPPTWRPADHPLPPIVRQPDHQAGAPDHDVDD